MLGVTSARAASALVKTRGLTPPRSKIPSTSIQNLNLFWGTTALASHGFEAVDWGTLEEKCLLFKPHVGVSVDDELCFRPTMAGLIKGCRDTASTVTSESDDVGRYHIHGVVAEVVPAGQ